MRSILASLLCLTLIPEASAGWRYQRYWTGCGYNYKKVYYADPAPVVEKQIQTTVVNNLVGIPVPVQYTEPIAAQGTSVYGYSSVAESYGNVDLGLLYSQASRLTDQAQQLAGQAANDFATIVQAEGQNRAEVAKIIARGQAVREALQASKGDPPQQIQRSFSFRVTQSGSGEMNIERLEDNNYDLSGQPSANLSGQVSAVLENKCLSCHNDQQAAGGLNLLESLTDQQQKSILDRVWTDDLNKRMPRNADGTAGQRLSVDEFHALVQAMNQR